MKRGLSGIFAALLVTSNAFAADLAPVEPVPEMPPEVTVTESTGWYLRGDVGYGFNDLRGAKFFQGSNADEASFDHADLRDAFTVGGGVGYQVNNYFRTDLTLDYLAKSDFHGSTTGGGAAFGALRYCLYVDRRFVADCLDPHGQCLCRSRYLWLLHALRRRWHRRHLREVEGPSQHRLAPTTVAGCDDEVTHGGRGNWRFSYGLMAGASIDVTCNVKADVGYRFLHVDGGSMFGYAENGGPGRDKGFNVHEARVGARYLFGGCQQASYEPPPEIPLQQPVYK